MWKGGSPGLAPPDREIMSRIALPSARAGEAAAAPFFRPIGCRARTRGFGLTTLRTAAGDLRVPLYGLRLGRSIKSEHFAPVDV